MSVNQIPALQCYLVGGAVRDKLLNLAVYDKDWVVVGSTVDEMLSLGFTQVGKDFPVFLHPQTKEEYALARTEKKNGIGYTGFICNASPDVNLFDDLRRRDLTINAMAIDDSGAVIDPYHGQKDLENRMLRHVSNAFIEDPLRILRVARFSARFHELNFTIAPETMQLMTSMSENNELSSLSSERIWQEMFRSLSGKNPDVFFQTLFDCKALHQLWPELASVWQLLSIKHSESASVDRQLISRSMNQVQFALIRATQLSEKVSVRFAVLFHFLRQELNANTVSEENNKPNEIDATYVHNFCAQLKVPNKVRDLAIKVFQLSPSIQGFFSLSAEDILQLFNKLDVWRKPDEFDDFLLACQAILSYQEHIITPSGANTENNSIAYHYAPVICLQEIYQQVVQVNAKAFIDKGILGSKIKDAMNIEKENIIRHFLDSYQ